MTQKLPAVMAIPPSPASSGAYPAYPTPPPTVQFPEVGTMLRGTRGEYAVQSIIGTGEFGAVYESVGPFDQIYALKMMRPANRPYDS
jgi:hypothetical protein